MPMPRALGRRLHRRRGGRRGAVAEVDLGVPADVTDRASTERLAEDALERFGRIDALVNAAVYGTIVRRPFEEISDDEWDRVLDVNVMGAWLCARAVAPAMRRQRRGKETTRLAPR
jgi:3-oxoacyl-[acyl-carrier protein] reductase